MHDYISVCEAPFIIENSDIIMPDWTSLNGTEFRVICKDGYYASEETGIMNCDNASNWENKPQCLGIIKLLLTAGGIP